LLDGKHARKILTETLCHARKIIFYRERGETISPKFNHRERSAAKPQPNRQLSPPWEPKSEDEDDDEDENKKLRRNARS
jgi:hypothetical protein